MCWDTEVCERLWPYRELMRHVPARRGCRVRSRRAQAIGYYPGMGIDPDRTRYVLLAIATSWLLAPGAADALEAHGGWYAGIEVGLAVPRELNTLAGDTDVPTNCDGHFPLIVLDGERLPLPLSDPRCARGQDQWANAFDLDNGPLVGIHVGYAWRGTRVEAEVLRRDQGGDEAGGQNVAGDKQVEFVETGERMGDVRGHQLFGNVYFDVRSRSRRVIPYVGAGIGRMRAKMSYRASWQRNPDAAAIEGFGRHPAAAGSVTAEDETLSDTLWGYHLIAGVDYRLTDSLFLGLKARYVGVWDEFVDGDTWDRLRGHASTVAPGGAAVRYTLETDDIGYWGASLNLKVFL